MKKGNIILILTVLLAGCLSALWFVEHKTSKGGIETSVKKTDYYYCAMHPWYHQDHPGNCAICGMTLIKREGGAPEVITPALKERKVKYWVDSMNPTFRQNHPGKAPDGMDLVPVYEEEGGTQEGSAPEALKGLAQIQLSPWKQQLIGLRTEVAGKKPVIRIVRTVGRVAGGPGDFAAAAGDFAAQGSSAPTGGRYLVADIYALDVPYVKTGQKAWVTSFSGSGGRVEGRVVQIYPYDGTQSRVRRVQINVPNLPSYELFADVEIEAASTPFLSVSADAVMTTGLHDYVYIEKSPQVFEPKEVTVGFEGDDDWQITSGLNEGDTVVAGANFMVDSDSKLKANFSAMDSQQK